MAIVTGLTITLAIPIGYFATTYLAAAEDRAYEARLSAGALSKYAYIRGEDWRFNKLRIADIVGFVEGESDPIRQIVYDEKGSVVVEVGENVGNATVSAQAPIVVGTATVGRVAVQSSLRPILVGTAIAAAIGTILGLGSFFAVDRLPMRALDRTLKALKIAHGQLEEQVVETTRAYEQLQSVHRKSEETADQLARTLREVEIASRTKSEFLANMSHELRTPLNAIIGFSDILMSETFGPNHPNYRGYAKDINDSGRHLLAIIVDILDMSKIEAGELSLRAETVDLGKIFRACVHLVSRRAEDAGVRLVIEPLPVPSVELQADPTKLKQIVTNLLSNGIKFTPPGGSVTIATAAPADGQVAFEVRDTGIGMSAEEIVLALQPFRQIDNSHTRKYEGTGLGLPLARALTELHGGELRVVSNPRSGTIVTVVLPLGAQDTTGGPGDEDAPTDALESAQEPRRALTIRSARA